MQLSRNFSLEEMCASDCAKARGIRNDLLTFDQLVNLTALCNMVLQPLRDWYGRSIEVSSGYRCKALNDAVGGVKDSQHMLGMAADLRLPGGDTVVGKMWMEHIEKCLPFDKLIWEHDRRGVFWIHVSYRADGLNRGIVIRDLLKR